MTSDDVQRGQLVAIIRHRCNDRECDSSYNGRPFRVVAVSHPFAVLEDCIDGERLPIDLREWELGKVDKRYVAALRDGRDTGKSAQPQRQDDHKRCVKCGERLVQRIGKGCLEWYWYCNECGAFKEAVKA